MTDPANVKLLTTPTGVISSEAGYRSFIKASLYPEAAATLSDGVILFPYFTVVMDNLVNQDMQAEFDFKVILPKEEPGEGVEQIMLNSSAAELQHAEVYDLYGRRMLNLENLKSGIYIVNGKKMQLK